MWLCWKRERSICQPVWFAWPSPFPPQRSNVGSDENFLCSNPLYTWKLDNLLTLPMALIYKMKIVMVWTTGGSRMGLMRSEQYHSQSLHCVHYTSIYQHPPRWLCIPAALGFFHSSNVMSTVLSLGLLTGILFLSTCCLYDHICICVAVCFISVSHIPLNFHEVRKSVLSLITYLVLTVDAQ